MYFEINTNAEAKLRFANTCENTTKISSIVQQEKSLEIVSHTLTTSHGRFIGTNTSHK